MRLKLKCDWCGKEFERKKNQAKEHNYCSRACLGKANAHRYELSRIKTCDYCSQTFQYFGHHNTRNKHFFCCKSCGNLYRTNLVTVRCDWCGSEIQKKKSDIQRNAHNFCDRGCYQDFINFKNAGAMNQRVAGKVLHRTFAEIRVGRSLSMEEEVHHIDGDHRNNASENLCIITTSEHSKIHASMKARDEYGRFVKKR